jgi:hypothetical protein
MLFQDPLAGSLAVGHTALLRLRGAGGGRPISAPVPASAPPGCLATDGEYAPTLPTAEASSAHSW